MNSRRGVSGISSGMRTMRMTFTAVTIARLKTDAAKRWLRGPHDSMEG